MTLSSSSVFASRGSFWHCLAKILTTKSKRGDLYHKYVQVMHKHQQMLLLQRKKEEEAEKEKKKSSFLRELLQQQANTPTNKNFIFTSRSSFRKTFFGDKNFNYRRRGVKVSSTFVHQCRPAFQAAQKASDFIWEHAGGCASGYPKLLWGHWDQSRTKLAIQRQLLNCWMVLRSEKRGSLKWKI